ncbi:MAG: TonB family protein [Candidatus Krumholzibacteriota bacterium]
MSTITLNHEITASKERIQRTLTISLLVHLVLFALLILRNEILPEPEGIVEIAWLDPDPAPAPPAPVPVQAKPVPVAAKTPVAPSPTEEKFERRLERAVVEPTPQEQTANRDRIKERVAALSATTLPNSALTAGPRSSNSLLQAAPSAVPDPGPNTPAVDLKRQTSSRPQPAPLKRGPVTTKRSAPALATVPREKPTASAAAPNMDAVARRTLEGAELAGEIANRPVVRHTMPAYPEWAKSQAVEATVTLYFVVLPDGRVKENIQIQKTAGFSDFDNSAIEALAQWRFQALSGGASQEQWGTITFRFRLRN